MATIKSNKALKTPIEATVAGQAVTICGQATVTVAHGALTDGDMIDLCILPPGHKFTSVAVACGDLDAGAALVFDVGTRDATDAVLETVFVSGATTGQATGTIVVPVTGGATASLTMLAAAAATVEKTLSIEITTTANTIHAAERTIDFVATYIAVQ